MCFPLFAPAIEGDPAATQYRFCMLFCSTERIRRTLEKSDIEYDGIHMQITISVGVAEYNANDEKLQNLTPQNKTRSTALGFERVFVLFIFTSACKFSLRK